MKGRNKRLLVPSLRRALCKTYPQPRMEAAAQPPSWAGMLRAFSAVNGYQYEDACKEQGLTPPLRCKGALRAHTMNQQFPFCWERHRRA
jgi:hypothetical protein